MTKDNSLQIQGPLQEILESGSYLMYEFKDKKVEGGIDTLGKTYYKYISPLFDNNVINAGCNQPLLKILLDDVPYYHLEGEFKGKNETSPVLSTNRDAGTLNVHSGLHTPFWSVWFRDAFAEVQNKIILDIYNKMQFPVVNENHYLNAKLFPKLASMVYDTTDNDEASSIQFKYLPEDNQEDIENGEYGCIEYLDNVVNEKLKATYSLMGYNPDQSELLTAWVDSKYLSGALDDISAVSEKSIFKLQDIQYELLRRKFAGSSTLYKLALASIDRRGSFVGAIPAGLVSSKVGVKTFKDQRLIRVLNIPGILSTKVSMPENNPYKVFYETPISENEFPMNLGTVTNLFYTSATQDNIKYNPEEFFIMNNPRNMSAEAYRSLFLRDNSSVINWNSPEGIISSKSVNIIYPKLDALTEEKEYNALDKEFSYTDEKGIIQTLRAPKLDIEVKTLNTRSVTANVLDINADTIMYHKNSLQIQQGELYKYVTYPIAENNSLSLMDFNWINYLKKATEGKSKVQDELLHGVQISSYEAINDFQLAEKSFFGISYSIINNPKEKYSYDDPIFEEVQKDKTIVKHLPRFAYLWYFKVSYNVDTFKVSNISQTLISKITLRITPERYTKEELATFEKLFSENKSYQLLKKYNIGIIPCTYTNSKNEDMVANYNFGPIKVGDNWQFRDDFKLSGYSSAYFAFSDIDNISERSNFQSLSSDAYAGPNPDEALTRLRLKGAKPEPSANTKSVYYIVRRKPLDSSKKDIKYVWSEPIPVVDTNSAFIEKLKNSSLYPDWMNQIVYINPYLNFKDSATPIRHKLMPASLLLEDIYNKEEITKVLTGPSKYCALSNLSCERRKDYLCNNTGDPSDLLVNGLIPEEGIGTFFEIIHPDPARYSTPEDPVKFALGCREYVAIVGDNRTKTFYSDAVNQDDTLYIPERIQIHKDPFERECLEFIKGDFDNPSSVKEIAYNVCRLNPFDTKKYLKGGKLYTKDNEELKPFKYDVDTIYSNWIWNKFSDGLSIFMNLRFSKEGMKANQKRITLIERRPFNDSLPEAIDAEFSFGLEKKDEGNWQFIFEMYPTGNTSCSFKCISKLIPEVTLINTNLRLNIGVKSYSGINNVTTELRLIINKDIYKSIYNTVKSNDKFNVFLNDIANDELTNKLNDSLVLNNISYPESSGLSEFIPGYLIKYIPGSNLKSISLFSSYDKEYEDENTEITQKNMFFGCLYDIRIYNASMSDEYAKIINIGSIRELYSNSPALYKLANTLYRDNAIFKRIKKSEGDLLDVVDTVRIFNRSVWDTILVDEYPISKEEMTTSSPQYVEDWFNPKDDSDIFLPNGDSKAVAQQLAYEEENKNSSEILNSHKPTELSAITYARKGTINIDTKDLITMLTTMIYPVNYKNQAFYSSGKLVRKRKDPLTFTDKYEYTTKNAIPDSELIMGAGIQVPAHAVNNSLEYSTDLDLNFTIGNVTHFDKFYDAGLNIKPIYIEPLKSSGLRITNSDLNNSPEANHIVIPFLIPKQEHINSGAYGYLDKFYLGKTRLSNHLVRLLRSTSYYNEVLVPMAYRENLNDDFKFLSRYIGIRMLKEGTYYFTVKYPFQILPFTDFDINTKTEGKPATLYATARLKIVVKGTPINYNADEIEGYPLIYSHNNLINSIRSGKTLAGARDNRTFPHRRINIDLFVMENTGVAGNMTLNSEGKLEENYSFYWKKVASNNDNTPGIQKLNSATLNNGLYLDAEIPLYFSRNYLTPFFIAKYNKAGDIATLDPNSADDDLIRPIYINPIFSDWAISEEKLKANSVEELDELSIVAGRPYRLLLDYNANVTEVSYTDKYFENFIDSISGLDANTKFDVQRDIIEETTIPLKTVTIYDENIYNKEESFPEGSSYIVPTREKKGYTFVKILDENNIVINPGQTINLTSHKDLHYVWLPEGSKEENNYKVTGEPTSHPHNKTYREQKTINETLTIKQLVENYINKDLLGDQVVKLDLPASIKVNDEFISIDSLARLYSPNQDIINIITSNDDNFKLSPNTLIKLNDNSFIEAKYVNERTILYGGLNVKKVESTSNTSNYIYSIELINKKEIPVPGLRGSIIIKNNYDETPDLEQSILDPEKINYCRLINLLDPSEDISSFIYNGSSEWDKVNTINITSRNGGFETSDLGFIQRSPSVLPSSKLNEALIDTEQPMYFGNPYSRSTNQNYLLELDPNNRSSVENIYVFPYMMRNIPEGYNVSALYKNRLNTVSIEGTRHTENELLNFNELSNVSNNYFESRDLTLRAIRSLNSSPEGLFDYLVSLKVNYDFYHLTSTSKKASSSEILGNKYDLYSLETHDTQIPCLNKAIKLNRRSVYTNNLIQIQNFANNNYWTNSMRGKYISDDLWDNGLGKDNFTITIPNNSNIKKFTMKYNASVGSYGASRFETAINIKYKHLTGVRVFCNYYSLGQLSLKQELFASHVSQGDPTIMSVALEENKWYTYTNLDTEKIAMDSVEFEITWEENTGIKYDPSMISITKAVVRTSELQSHYLGLSNTIISEGEDLSLSSLIISGNKCLVFKHKKDNNLIPLLLENKIKKRPSSYGASNTKDISYMEISNCNKFIEEYSIENNKNVFMKKMLKPWLQNMRYSERTNKMEFHPYRISLGPDGIKKVVVSSSPSYGIYTYENKEKVPAIEYNEANSNIEINSLIIKRDSDILGMFDKNMEIMENNSIALSNEKFSALTNCFFPEKYATGYSPVAVTNIQLLAPEDKLTHKQEIIYEYEYLPIIYDEATQHLSLNMLIHKKTN